MSLDDDIDPHPLADRFDPGDWDRQGRCICGDPLPPQREWARAGMDWSNILCDNCGRGYVDEEDFFAIYDAEQTADAGDEAEWMVRSVKGIAMRCGPDRTSVQAWVEVLDSPCVVGEHIKFQGPSGPYCGKCKADLSTSGGQD